MPKSNNAHHRYRRIHEKFSRHVGHRTRGIKLEALADELNISLRQVNDDIKYLREMGAPLEYVPSLRAWRYKEGEDFLVLEDQLLNTDELSSLRIAFDLIQRMNFPDLIPADLPKVFQKIYKAAQKWVQPDTIQKSIYFDPLPRYEGSKHLKFFLKAIEAERRVSFQYLAFHSETSKNVIFDPWFLRYYDHRWYAGGFSHDASELFVRVFPLERIVGTPSHAGFYHDKPPQYSAETYWKNIYGISVPLDGVVEDVVLEFSNIQGKYFLSSPFFTPYEVLETSYSAVVVKLRLIVNIDLVRKLASFGKEMRVVAPGSLVETMKRFFEEALAASVET